MSRSSKLLELYGDAEERIEGPAHLEITTSLMMRCLEWARESAQTDIDLHKMVENMVIMNSTISVLGIDCYEELLDGTTPEKVAEEPTVGDTEESSY